MVSDFVGERYSLVFFTAADYKRAKEHTMRCLSDCGMECPSDALLSYYMNLLAPARGKCKSIRNMFGYNERQGAIQWSGLSLSNLPDDAMYGILQRHLCPLVMSSTCSLSQKLKQFCYNPSSWEGSVIDARTIRPAGRKSHSHYLLWPKSAAVINGAWCCSNVSLLMSTIFRPWKWLLKNDSPIAKSCGKFLSVSQSPVLKQMTVKFEADVGDMIVGLCTSRDPKEIIQCAMKGSKKHNFYGMILDMSDNTSTLMIDNIEFPDQAFVGNFLGSFLTITLGAEDLTGALGGKCVSVPHGHTPDKRPLFAVAIMDKKTQLAPCWAIL
jgi:hypothetical protein